MNNRAAALPWRRLIKVGKPFWVSGARKNAFLHLAAVLALMLANAGVNFLSGKTTGAVMTAIENQSTADLRWWIVAWVASIAVATPVQVFYAYFRTRLALLWRDWLSKDLFSSYFARQVYLRLTRKKDLDNPDQRMAQDVDSFCNSAVGLSVSIIDALVNVVMFIGVLWSFSGTLTLTVIAYSGIGSVVVFLIGRSLVDLTFELNKTEGDLRFGLGEVRREAESIALYCGEELNKDKADTRLDRVIATLMRIMRVHRNMQLFTNPFYALVPVIPAAIMAQLYFGGSIKFGDITQASMAFQSVFSGLTFLVGQFGGIASFAAIVNRLGGFVEGMEQVGSQPEGKRIDVREGADIVFERVTIFGATAHEVLVDELTVAVDAGRSLLVTCPDGAASTAVLKAASRLVSSGSGKLQLPPAGEILYIDRAPYVPPCTLREAMSYPSGEPLADDERLDQILNLLDLCDLPALASGFDTEQDWRETLSASQLQRLGLARIINLKPKYVLIDQTSSTGHDTEKLLYTLLTSISASFITAGNDTTLAGFHTQVIEIATGGAWKNSPAKAIKRPSAGAARGSVSLIS